MNHTWKEGARGRSIRIRPGVGGSTVEAKLSCSKCGKSAALSLPAVLPPEQIDKKFTRAGWKLDPAICLDCQNKRKEQKKMASTTTTAAMKAQAVMFRLLSDHFDGDAGAYSDGWDDARVSKETGLAVAMVGEFRRAGFGEIKEPDEIAKLRADIASVENLMRDHQAALAQQVAELKTGLAKLTAKFAA